MKKALSFILILSMVFTALFAQALQEETRKETITFVDSSGRTVEIPKVFDKVAPSGAVATMFLAVFAPERMSLVSCRPSSSQLEYLP